MNIFKSLILTAKNYLSTGQSFTNWIYEWNSSRSRKELLNEYKNIVYACITTIADEIGMYEPQIIERMSKETVPTHPLLELLEHPNPQMTKSDLFGESESFIELTGEVFWYFVIGEITRKPQEVYILRPDRVKIAIDEGTGEVKGYSYVRDDGTEIPFTREEVVHFKNFNPSNQYRGLGTVQAGLLYINTETAVSEFQNSFMNNQASPSGVLTINSNITDEAFNSLKKKWREQYEGTSKAGKTLFLRKADVSFTKIGLSIADIDLGGVTDITERKVRQMFKVPKILLGELDNEGLSRASVDTAEYIFGKKVIEPKMGRWDDFLTVVLEKYYPQPSRLSVIHQSKVSRDMDQRLREREVGVDKWITRNEVRIEDGYEPIDGGDQLFIGFNTLPLTSSQTQKSIGKVHIKRVVRKEASEDSLFEVLQRIEVKTNDSYRRKIKKLIESQKEEVLKIISEQIQKQLASYDGVNWDLTFEDEGVEGLIAILINALINGGESIIEILGTPDTEFVVLQAIRDAIFDSTSRLMKSFNEETSLKIQKQLADWFQTDESKDQLVKRIESVYSDAKGYRARRIADTESHKAVNAGTAEAYKQAGYKKMRWVANPDACEFCKRMDGRVITIGQSFVPLGGSVEGVDGGEYMNDYEPVKFADLHPGCRCYLEAKK